MNEKQELEKAAIQKFTAAYNGEFPEASLQIVRRGDSPDGLVRQGGREFGIEIAHSFGSQFDARKRLGRAGDIPSNRRDQDLWDRHLLNSTIPLVTRILGSLNDVLRKKASKRYMGETWLLIQNANPLWGKSDFEKNQPSIRLWSH